MRQETHSATTSKPRSTAKATTAKRTSSKTAAKAKSPKAIVTTYSVTEQVSPELRYHMIAEAAYFYAEERGFGNGSELDDWLRAETSIDELLHNGNDSRNGATEKR